VNASSLNTIDLSANILLETVYCGHNNLSTLDLSGLNKLKFLECGNNNIPNLSFNPENSSLETLWCNSNGITSLDIDNCVNLTNLICSGNSLSSINLQNNTLLEELQIDDNPMGTMDLTKNTVLRTLSCYSSQLTALDLSKNTLLEILYCRNNIVTELNIDNNVEITELNFSDNAISAIDLSNNAKLEYLTAENTTLESLSIAYNFNIRDLTIGTNSFSTICIGNEDDYVLDQIPLFRMAYTDYTFEECIVEFNPLVSVNDASGTSGSTITIPVLVDNILIENNIISYQFNVSFNSEIIELKDFNLDNCIVDAGEVQLNEVNAGLYSISYMTTDAIYGTGAILNLEFELLDCGTSDLQITDFLFNTTEVTDIETASITSNCLYGDIDANTLIQAYDAALTLQHSVGLDPIPEIDGLPWDKWRETIANVDGIENITAYDASLILQHTIGLISEFPAESSKKNSKNTDADVDIALEGDKIVFRSKGDFLSFNIKLENDGRFGTPVITADNILSEMNLNDSYYQIGLCSATSLTEGTPFLEIPFTSSGTITLYLTINNEIKTVQLTTTTTSIDVIDESQINLFPVPATDKLTISGMNNITDIAIYSITGEKMKQESPSNNSININDLSKGVYFIKIRNNKNEIVSKRFIKQ